MVTIHFSESIGIFNKFKSMTIIFYYLILFLVPLLALIYVLKIRKFRNLPPGPISLPIIGNLHQLKQPLHRTLHRLSKNYGQIFSLWFGNRLVVVVSSPSAVHECFTKNDIVLADRPRFLADKYVGYNHSILVSSPYGDHWRNLRRIVTLDLFSTQRLNSFLDIRRDEVMILIKKLAQDSYKDFAKVELKSKFYELTFNIIMRMISGKRYYGDDCDVSDVEEAMEFREMIKDLFSVLGTNNPGDFLAILKWFDFGNIEKKLQRISQRMDDFCRGLIDEHRNGKKGKNTMIDHLLILQESQPEYYTDQIIKGLVVVMLLAGTDSSAVTLEWAMSNLLNHSEFLKKAREELNTQIGQDRLVEEEDISKLPYLQNIITETFRLYPAGPLLLPHLCSDDCIIGGYNVPKDSIVLVNAWALHRDPQLWSESSSFKPERFEKQGERDKIIPFGMGRRVCPGAGLAQRTVGWALASLIQCFEWERMSEEEIDMQEGKGITMPKVIPLEAMCKARPVIDKVFSENTYRMNTIAQ